MALFQEQKQIANPTVQMPTTCIYELTADHAFKDFVLDGFADSLPFIERFNGTVIGTDLKGTRLSLNPDTPDGPLPDYSSLSGLGIGVFSDRAVTVLRQILDSHGQLFAVEFPQSSYFLYNITTMIDALDHQHCVLEYWPRIKRVFEFPVRRVLEYAFHEQLLQNVHLFKIPEFPTTQIYVTGNFVEEVQSRGLTGFRFTRLWSSGE